MGIDLGMQHDRRQAAHVPAQRWSRAPLSASPSGISRVIPGTPPASAGPGPIPATRNGSGGIGVLGRKAVRGPAAARAECSHDDADRAGFVTYLHNREPDAVDAIHDYSRHLTRALCEVGTPAAYVDGGLHAILAGTTCPPWILLQYNPNSYGRRGWAPGLVRDALGVRRRWPQVRLVLTVHEAWVDIADLRTAVMATYQRAQLRALLRIADSAFVTRATLELGARSAHLPVASNIAPAAATRQEARARLGLGDELVVALFGRANPDRLLDHAACAIAAICEHCGPAGVHVMNLGRDAPAIAVPTGVRTSRPGGIDSEQIALRMRASDLLLLPFSDGASTRRTTVMAGLAHGLPIVGLNGPNTDPILLDHPDAIVLTPVADRTAFAHAAVALAGDPERRRLMSAAGRHLYEREFDWPILARRLSQALCA